MLKKADRLPRQKFGARDFTVAARTSSFSIRIRKNDEMRLRIGVVVPKAVVKTATQRNFLKRQIKDIALRLASPGTDTIITVLGGIRGLTKRTLKEELIKIIKKSAP